MTNIEIPSLGTGLWRGPQGVPDSPDPADASDAAPAAVKAMQQGPSLVRPPDITVEDLQVRIAAAARAILQSSTPDEPDGQFQGNTDANGDAYIGVYAVAAGFEFLLARLVVWSDGYTPAAPFSSGSAWIAVYRSDTAVTDSTSFSPGAVRDFGPATSGGPLLPCLFSDAFDSCANYKGPCTVALRIEGGPASKLITGYYAGQLRRIRGVT